MLTTWPEDGGPFVTLPLVYTEHPDGKGHNLGMYRLHVHDARTTGMHWQIGKGGGFHYAVAEARGQALPVTVFLGGPPALILAAIAPLPENVPELMLASLIAGERLKLVAPGPGPHPLVASAEFALIGKVPPRVRRPEGPFGDHYGYYSLQHDYPVFEVEQIARREDAIYPATVVGKPRQEDFFIGDLLQELLSPLFPLVMPAVEQLWSYGETGYHSLAAAVVKQRYKREAMASAFRILGEGQLSLTKFLLVTDRAVDLKDFRATLDPRPRAHAPGDRPLRLLEPLDGHARLHRPGGQRGLEGRLARPRRSGARAARAPSPRPRSRRAMTDVHVFCPGCLVVGGPAYADDPGAAARFAAHPAFAGWPLVVLTDEPRRAAASPINFLWTTFTRFEPAADLHAAATALVRHHVSYTPPILIDARMKPWYPKELFADEETAATVTRRWKEYFPGGKVEMGDSGTGHLAAHEPPPPHHPVIAGAAIALLLTERLRADLVALLVVVALGTTGVLTSEETFSGFSRSAVITLLAIFILAAGLERTGVTRQVGDLLVRVAGRSEQRLVVVVMLAAAFLSLFMNNIAAAAVLLPAVSGAAQARRASTPRGC